MVGERGAMGGTTRAGRVEAGTEGESGEGEAKSRASSCVCRSGIDEESQYDLIANAHWTGEGARREIRTLDSRRS
jgi:hypothetical protein